MGPRRSPGGDAERPDESPVPADSGPPEAAYVDSLEERVRRRIAERREIETAGAADVDAERRSAFVHFRGTVVRRLGQAGGFVGDLIAGLAGLGAPRGAADAAPPPAESYGARVVRRWTGRGVLYRLQQIDDEILVRSALACDVVDLARILRGSSNRLPALLIGRFDGARGFLHGGDARARGMRCTVRRRPDGDFFSIRDTEGWTLPPLSPDAALLLLAHHRESDGRFRWAPVLHRVASKAVTTAALVQWNADLVRRVRDLGGGRG